jgi:hypothetical protein
VGKLELGHLPKGGQRKVEFWVENLGEQSVAISSIKSSCECFTLALGKTTIPPGGRVKAIATVDFSHDSDFAGSLLLDAIAEGRTTSEPLFAVYLSVTVE